MSPSRPVGAGVVLADDLAATVVIADDYPAAVAAAIADTSEFDSFTGRLTAGLTPGTVVLNWGTVQAAPADPVTADPNFTG